MKALVKTRPEPGLELVEVPDPVAGPNDVIVKVMRTGICGTDVHIDKWDGWAAKTCLLYTSPSPRDQRGSRMPSSA